MSLGHTKPVGDILGYVDWATQFEAAYLQASDEVFRILDEFGNWWSVNEQFLDDAIKAGVERFHLQLPEARVAGNFAGEIAYRLRKGFKKVFENGEYWLVRP